MAMEDYLDEPEVRERFIENAFKENPRIKSFTDFVEAFEKAFGTTRGQRVLNNANGEEMRTLWESDEMRDKLKDNLTSEEIEQAFGESTDQEVLRDVPKGEELKHGYIITSPASKFNVKTKSGLVYQKSYSKWSPAQNKFIQVRRMRGDTPKAIIYEYNRHFKEQQRSEKSLRTKIYRL